MNITSLVRTALRRDPVRVSTNACSAVVSAQETIALMLDKNAPVPKSDQDVHDLVLRLRGHLTQLGLAAGRASRGLTDALSDAWELAGVERPAGFMEPRVHLRKLALAVQAVITEMGAGGLVCEHQPECPLASEPDCQAARVLSSCSALGYSLLCNGVIVFEDTGCLKPDGEAVEPRRPLPLVRDVPKVVGA